ncbi:MAG: hypothetical protein KGM44_06580, partial [bacterium]|nr:hypothetical protein [bacterium]
AFLGSLLAPVRSGMLLVRDDLVRAARELGLGFRYAERRFVLKALLAQDAGAVLGWLAREAERWIELHRTLTPAPARIRAFWLERAAASARLLTLLRSEIDAVKECS